MWSKHFSGEDREEKEGKSTGGISDYEIQVWGGKC